MSDSLRADVSSTSTVERPSRLAQATDRQTSRWGGIAALIGVIFMLISVGFVVGFGAPDASDPESLIDFADIEMGRIGENSFYFGATIMFAFHAFALAHLLRRVHLPAALFGVVAAGFGYAMMAGSALIHVATSPLSELYDEPGVSPENQQGIEYAWYAMQAVMDLLLTAGVFLVPMGIVLFSLAMRRSGAYGSTFAMVALALGLVGVIGAGIAVVIPGSMSSAAAVLAIVLFNLVIGWRTLKLPATVDIDLT